MGTARLISSFALLVVVAACVSPPSRIAPAQRAGPVTGLPAASEVPLLYVVDGVAHPRDRIPDVSPDQVASVRVLKGRAALLKYGPDASYGVVIITTKRVAAVAANST